MCKRLKEQLTLPRNRKKPTIFDATPHNACCEKNVVCMQRNLQDSNVLVAVSGRDLQVLDGTPATPEQQRDLIAFRDIGQQYYEAYVKYYIVRHPSAKVPLRKRRLLTFCALKQSSRQIKHKECKQKLVSRCIGRQLASSEQTGTIQGEQYLELPCAVCSPSGMPHEGPKCYATKFIEKHCSDVILSMFPGGWVPDTIVLEGMFLINTAPLITHSTMGEYAQFLVRRFSIPHCFKGVKEVYIVFDRPACNLHTC